MLDGASGVVVEGPGGGQLGDGDDPQAGLQVAHLDAAIAERQG